MDHQMDQNDATKSLVEAAHRVGPAVLPIGRRPDGRQIEAFGSGFLLDVAGSRLLITAAHVLNDPVGPRYLFGPTGMIRLKDAFEVRAQPGPNPDVDLAFLVPERADLAQIGAEQALRFNAELVVPTVGPPDSVTCFGLPISHTQRRGAGTNLHGSMTVLTGPVSHPSTLLQTTRFHPATHFGFEYDANAVPHLDGTIRKGRSLHGVSGGPVFLPQGWLVDGIPLTFLHLAGILIGGQGPKLVAATRIETLSAALVQHGIASPQDLPTSSLSEALPLLAILSLPLT